MSLRKLFLVAVLAIGFASSQASAAIITWADWTSATYGFSGSASGTVGSVGVTYSGQVAGPTQVSGGIDYWNVGNGTPNPYTNNGVIGNIPTNTDIISVIGGQTLHTITFSQAVTNPVMLLLSLGQVGIPITYMFDQNVTLLSYGKGYWGGGAGDGSMAQSGNNITGREGHGAVQFNGTFTQITWSIPFQENWHGFTVGTLDNNPVPEPTSILLGAVGLAGLALRRKFFRKLVASQTV